MNVVMFEQFQQSMQVLHWKEATTACEEYSRMPGRVGANFQSEVSPQNSFTLELRQKLNSTIELRIFD
eukprot:1589796-Amphidinium_carterae.2